MSQIDSALLDRLDTYLGVSRALNSDVEHLLDCRTDLSAWKRNYIRVLWSFIEAQNFFIGQIVREIVRLESSSLTAEEEESLSPTERMCSSDRVKFTLRAASKSMQIPAPAFDDANWKNCLVLINRRHRLVHPKSKEDIEMDDDEWEQIWSAGAWLFRQYASYMRRLSDIANSLP